MPENRRACLELRNLSRTFGGLKAVNGVSLSVQAGERRALIGPNGAGKTTLFNLISGEIRPTEGSIVFQGADVTALPPHRRAARGIARTFQITRLFAARGAVPGEAAPVARGPDLAPRPLRRGCRLRYDSGAVAGGQNRRRIDGRRPRALDLGDDAARLRRHRLRRLSPQEDRAGAPRRLIELNTKTRPRSRRFPERPTSSGVYSIHFIQDFL